MWDVCFHGQIVYSNIEHLSNIDEISYLGWFSSKFLVFFWGFEVIYKFLDFNFCFFQSSNISKLDTFNLDTIQDFFWNLSMNFSKKVFFRNIPMILKLKNDFENKNFVILTMTWDSEKSLYPVEAYVVSCPACTKNLERYLSF